MPQGSPELTLYTNNRSSCAARVRISLNLKQLPYSTIHVNVDAGEHNSREYATINPSRFVPTLQHTRAPGGAVNTVSISQSLAILEYIEEAFPGNTTILPSANDPAARATVRALSGIIACDTQPVTNTRILSRVDDIGGSWERWARDLTTDGLAAYERLASKTSGRFSVGDQITMADVCLVPAVWNAKGFGVDLAAFPVVQRVFQEMSQLQAVATAHYDNQSDTPETFG